MSQSNIDRTGPTVEMSGITRSYRSQQVLQGLTLDLWPGVTGLLGPNGAGKTTLLRMLATVLAPDGGELRLLGRDLGRGDQRIEVRRRLGYVPQEPGFHQDFSAFDFVDYVAILKEMTDSAQRHAEVRRVLQVVGLDDVRHRKLRRLSGGMRRRVAIAQALLGRPELLVLDEPTVGLDPEQRLRFREMLAEVGPAATVVLSTHQTGDVAALCGRVVVLHDGAIRFDGTPAELAATAAGQVWLSDRRDPHARIAWNTAEGEVRNVGAAPEGAQLIEPTIEDGYLLLVGSGAQEPTSEAVA
ncbi:MAG: ATP-binding cassette domain-containing protein [Microthrixaceae bacterium]